jgi:hypothetical protein
MATPEFAPLPGWTGPTTPEAAPPISLDLAAAFGKLTKALLAGGKGELHTAAELAMRGALDLKSLVGDPVPAIIPPPRSLTAIASDLGAIAETLRELGRGRAITGLSDLVDDVSNAGAEVDGWAQVISAGLDVTL